MRRNAVPLLIFAVVAAGLVVAALVYSNAVAPRIARNHDVLTSASDVRIGMSVRYAKGALAEERWTMRDRDGLSTSSYRAVGRNGVQVTIDERPREVLDASTNVAYLFGKVVQDGIWDLASKPPRGDTNATYRIDVYQLITGQHGSRSFAFTDPHYWATTGGHQFTIHLDKNKPVPDLLHLSSTTLVEPRYEQLVQDFRTFGPQSFRDRIASEKKRRFGIAS